jgi:uncharacterized protein
MPLFSRRHFLRYGALTAGGLAVARPFDALMARVLRDEAASEPNEGLGYGPLSPVRDDVTGLPLLLLPPGFRYVTYGWTGDRMSDGRTTPPAHDGMAAFAVGRTRLRLVRNHERGGDAGAFARRRAYDPSAAGGTTTLEFDAQRGRFTRSWVSLSGTAVNCAGGPTPWGTWLSCEETVVEPRSDNRFTRPHGYIFEVPVKGQVNPIPLKAMGRFVHEAIAVDPDTGIVYETEDHRSSGFYRFLPNRRRRLDAGGQLQMLAVEGHWRLDTRTRQSPGQHYPVTWVNIADPDRPHADPALGDRNGVFMQGHEQGGALFGRLEGAWYGNDRIYFVSTNGGDAAKGQIWEYDPRQPALRLVFESPSGDVLNHPDNICVSPRGGLVLCEDGFGDVFVHGLTTGGQIFRFAQNNVVLHGERNGISGSFTDKEFAGATFSPDGEWLFFNIQTPGITFAVTGPWAKGPL